jgi:hypothetical protein
MVGRVGLVTGVTVLSEVNGEVTIEMTLFGGGTQPGCEDGTVLLSGDDEVSSLCYCVGGICEL